MAGDTSAPVAPKVKWAALVGALVGLILTGLPVILGDPTIFPGVPTWLSIVLGVLAGGGLPGVAGYAAPHQPRPEDYGTTAGPVGTSDYPEGYTS